MDFSKKEQLIKLLNGVLDGHSRLNQRSAHYCEGIKHVRDLMDQTFHTVCHPEEVLEFCVSIICSIQPEEPKLNRYLSDLEKGILAAAYFLYTAMHPLQIEAARNE
jgi:hypothetical protein